MKRNLIALLSWTMMGVLILFLLLATTLLLISSGIAKLNQKLNPSKE